MSLQFDANTDAATAAETTTYVTTDIIASTVLLAFAGTASAEGTILRARNSGSSYLDIRRAASGQITVSISGGATGGETTFAPSNGTWMYLALVTQANADWALYGWTTAANPPTTIKTGSATSPGLARLYLGYFDGGGSGLPGAQGYYRYLRAFSGVKDTTEILAEMTSATAVSGTGQLSNWQLPDGTTVTDDIGAKDLTITSGATGTSEPGWIGAVTRYLKLLAHASAASASSIAGAVFAVPTGSDITGAKIGEFTGAAFEAALESGQAVLLVDTADFGGGALTTASTPVAVVRNTTNTTGVVSCTVIEV
jgi:hypothetical protein